MIGKLNFSRPQEMTKYVSDNNIKILNLCHVPEDGRLKTLSFSAADNEKILEVLEFGERVDGSSLFSFIEPGKSDIYVKPGISEAFVNPFSTLPSLNVMCDYLDENGKPLNIAPKNILARAENKLKSSSGVVMKALAELEFYAIFRPEDQTLFKGEPDRNYHESSPFAHFENPRNEILAILAQLGIKTKYAHGEVGRINRGNAGFLEQHEIELEASSLSYMADAIAIAKWVIRNVSARYGIQASFVPKMDIEHAGTGMHVHFCGLRNGKNVIANADGTLSSEGLQMIGGLLRFAWSLSAFGNPTPASYVRFALRKESPLHACWSARSRMALVRIPLWWSFKKAKLERRSCKQTIEYRAPDAFANPSLLFAAMAVAAEHGLADQKESLKIAEDLHVDGSFPEGKKELVLPRSCAEAAEGLKKDRRFFEADGVFPQNLVSKTIDKLESYEDRDLWRKVTDNPKDIENVVERYLNHG